MDGEKIYRTLISIIAKKYDVEIHTELIRKENHNG